MRIILSSYFPSSFLLFLKCLFYPALTGSKTPTSKFNESKEARYGSTTRKSPIGSTNNQRGKNTPTD
ncbi:hypothetical protein CO726_05535 [Bacillus fungorum]|uniref:Spermidine/putrescine ABC transporter ATP-binding protein n=1 Tax=Bacillus fungorum TaxID=2039284 RepID=A0A2G6QH87_9BACI|nr:hypothetical protein CO726_05535 [Bacillus fungorum]